MTRYELYRLVVADELDLLDDDGRRRLQELSATHPDFDRSAFIAGVREAMGAPDGDEELLRSLEEAERHLTDIPGVTRVPPPARSRRPSAWRIGLIAAASVAVVWLAGRFVGPAGLPPSAPQSVRLSGMRDGDPARVDLDREDSPVIRLMAGARPAEPVTRWELRDGAGESVTEGAVAPGEIGSPLPPIEIRKDALRAAQPYWLVLLSDDDRVIREWRFDVD